MRFCGSFVRLEDLAAGEEGVQTHRAARELVHSTLLPIDHADGRAALQARLTERVDGGQRGPSGRDHVLDEAHHEPDSRPVTPVRTRRDTRAKEA